MPNITIQVPNELYHHARIAAARRNMTVSALLRTVLACIDPEPIEGTPDSERFQEFCPPMHNYGSQFARANIISNEILIAKGLVPRG